MTYRPLFDDNTLRKSLQTTSDSSTTSKQCFELTAASFLVCSLIFIEYKLARQATRPTNSYKKAHEAISFAGFSDIGDLDKAL